MPIIHKKMSLFDAPEDSVLVHACNAMGVWGSGIAKEFKKRFPEAFDDYNYFCLEETALGKSFFSFDQGYTIGCLITSQNFGQNVDSPEEILTNTRKALDDFLSRLLDREKVVYSNKFNSGLFNVPWEKTEEILKELLPTDITWIVCEQ